MTAPRSRAAEDLRADLMHDLEARQAPLDASQAPTRRWMAAPRRGGNAPTLEMRVTPTSWSIVRRTAHGVKVGPVSVSLTTR